MKHIKILSIVFLIVNAFVTDANSQSKDEQKDSSQNIDSSKVAITDTIKIPPTNESKPEAWWNKLVYLCVGAFLALIGGIIRDIFIDCRDKKRIRQAIIAEIERNCTYPVDENDNIAFAYPKMWFTAMFDGNIGKISYFNKEEISQLIQIYSWMHDFKSHYLDIPKEDRSAETVADMRKQANSIKILCQDFIVKYKLKE